MADALADGLPVFGTCAGMILLATTVLDGRDDQLNFGVIDLTIRRNGYGRQIASFEGVVEVPLLGDGAPACGLHPGPGGGVGGPRGGGPGYAAGRVGTRPPGRSSAVRDRCWWRRSIPS